MLLGNGDGSFTGKTMGSGTFLCSGYIVAADFNGDGIADVATPNQDVSGTVAVSLTQLTKTATATVTGISPIGTGTHAVEASYPGDSIYDASVSVTTGLTAIMPFTVSGTAVTVTPGATKSNASTITVTPAWGFTGNVALTAKITSSPAGAQYPPTWSFGSTSPVSIIGASAGTATLTISTTAPSSAALVRPNGPGVLWYAGGSTALACVLLFGIQARRRRWRSMLGMLALLATLASGMLACGGNASSVVSTSYPGTTAGTYTVTVTGVSGSITATNTITLIVQ
jgi:hypothetical protein